MWEKLRRFSALGREARGIFLRAIVALPKIARSLRRRGFQGTRASLSKGLSPLSAIPGTDTFRIESTVRMVRAAARYGIGKPSCLEESLTLWWFLARQGIASDLRIGVRKERETFEAHAWVERDGVALNEPESRHTHYAAFDSEFPRTMPETR
jgi:transglutaminase superfamily protein